MRHFFVLTLTILFSLNIALAQDMASIPRLSNKEIIKMAAAGVSSEVIISKIKISRCNFDTDPTLLAELKQKGVSNEVLKAMIEAPYGFPKQQVIERSSANLSIDLKKEAP